MVINAAQKRSVLKQTALLGMFTGTARHRLIKLLLFSFIQETNRDICFRCGQKIESIEVCSIDHKESWIKSANPKKLYFSLDNIAFSHLSCNIGASQREKTHCPRGHLYGERKPNQKVRYCSICKVNRARKDRLKNPERVRERALRWVRKNKDYYQKNKERFMVPKCIDGKQHRYEKMPICQKAGCDFHNPRYKDV